ncbi:MAG TPA: hypothetical protein VFV01_47990 [Spirillospora sp.]|nr:hypothetical protein [Spirillospora sp.]
MTAQHGTETRYYLHLRGNKTTAKTPPCDACLAAHRTAEAARAARRSAGRRAAREAARQAKLTCPSCGGTKTRTAALCHDCWVAAGRPHAAYHHPRRPKHGTDSGYYLHLRGNQTTPPSPPCEACLAAHAARSRPPGAPPRRYLDHHCPDCGARISRGATRCAPCAADHAADRRFTGSWRLVRGVWKPVAA